MQTDFMATGGRRYGEMAHDVRRYGDMATDDRRYGSLFDNLQLFGEGGDGGAGAAPAGESAGPEGEGAGVIAPDAGEQKKRNNNRQGIQTQQQVVFGRPAPEETASPSSKQAAENPGKPEAAAAERLPYEEIKKMYKDDIGRDIKTSLDGRFKYVKETENRAARMEALLSRMGSLDYEGIVGEDGKLNLDALEKAVDDDDRYYEKRAEERGWSTETEKYVSRLERKDAQRQAEEAARQRDIVQRQQFDQRMAQAAEAKKVYPGLDFFAEMDNRTFASLMANPLITVQQAYELVHRDEIAGAMMQEASSRTAQAMSNAIQAGAARPRESGLGNQAAANVSRILDPRQMTKEQRKLAKEQVRRGAKIYW